MLRWLFSEAALSDDAIRSTTNRFIQTVSIFDNNAIAGIKVICASDGSFLPPEKFYVTVLNRPGDYQNGGHWPMYTLTILARRYKSNPNPTLKQTIEQSVMAELAIDHHDSQRCWRLRSKSIRLHRECVDRPYVEMGEGCLNATVDTGKSFALRTQSRYNHY
jgi:hypothetical protein